MLSPTLRPNTKPVCYVHRMQSNMECIVINRNKLIKILLLITLRCTILNTILGKHDRDSKELRTTHKYLSTQSRWQVPRYALQSCIDEGGMNLKLIRFQVFNSHMPVIVNCFHRTNRPSLPIYLIITSNLPR